MDTSVNRPIPLEGSAEIFERLYHEGEKANRKKADLSKYYPFQPTLS